MGNWNEDSIISELVNHLSGLAEVTDVDLVSPATNSQFEYLLRVALADGSVCRFVISGIEDEEIEEDFDSVFWSDYIEEAFENIACSCYSLRSKIQELEGQFIKERRRLTLELAQTEKYADLSLLREKISEIDRNEHPQLNILAREATPFISVWLQELKGRSPDVRACHISRDLANSFAEAWLGGWRPPSSTSGPI